MTDWFVMTRQNFLSLPLMQGHEDGNAIGAAYTDLPRADLLFMSNDRLGTVIYSHELRTFWAYKTVWKKDLPSMKFGLSADGKVVCGVDAIEITVESCYALCKKAPYGARKKVRAFYGKSGK